MLPGGIEGVAASGVRDVRFMVRPGSEANYDDVMARAHRLGMRIVVTPLGSMRDAGYPDQVARLVRRWPQVDAVTAGNEPEINGYRDDPCGYARLTVRVKAAARSVRPIRVIVGENSPHATFPWLKALARCPAARRMQPRDWGFHPYQWSTDPMSPRQLDSQDGHGDWLGIGRLPRVKRWMARKTTLRAFGIRRAPRTWLTEFGYMERKNGMELASPSQIRAWWPRAMVQASRLEAEAIFAQGALTSGAHRDWNSAMPHGLLASVASQ